MSGVVSSMMLRLLGDPDDAENAFDSVGNASGELVGKLAAVATGALGIGAAFATALENTNVQGRLAGKLGINPAEAKKLGEVAGRVYANAWGESLTDVSDAVAMVKTDLNDLAAPEEFEGLTTKALALADTFDVDVGQAVQAVGQLVRTGLVKDANEGFDLITKSFQVFGQRGDDVLDTLKEYPVQFQALGLSGAQAIGILRQGLAGGARDTDLVADALKEFGLRARDGSTSSAAAFKSLGLNAQKMTAIFAKGGAGAASGLQLVIDKIRAMKDPVARTAAVNALFGTQAEDMQAAIMAINPKTAVKGLGDLAGVADKMVTSVGTSPQATLESFKRKIEVALGESMAKSVPALQASLDKFAPMIPEIISGITSVLNVAVPILVNVLGLIAPYAPTLTRLAIAAVGVKLAMMGFGAVSGVISTVRAGIQGTSLAMSIFQARMAGSAAINAGGAFGAIANAAGGAARGIGTATVAVGRWIATQAVAAASGIRTAASVVATNVAMAAQATWGGIIRVATLLWTGVQWLLNASFYGFPLVWIIAAIIAVVAIIVLIATKTTWFQTIWNFVWGAIVAYFNFVVGLIKGAAAGFMFIFGTWLPGVFRGFWNFVVGVFLGFHNFMLGIVKKVIGFFVGFGTFIFVTLPARIRLGTSIMISNFLSFVSRIWNAFVSLPGRLVNIGRDIVTGIWRGISNMGGWLWQQVTGFANNIIQTMMHAIGARSPSRKAAEKVGKPVAQGTALGMLSNAGIVQSAAATLAAHAIPDTGAIGARAGASLSGAAAGGPGGDQMIHVDISLPGVGVLATALLKWDRQTGRLGLAGTV